MSELSLTNTIEYLHNANNQRVAKKVDGVIIEKYLWRDLTTLLAIYNSDDTLRTRFSYAEDRVPYKMIHNSETYYLSYNHLGSLRAVTDSSGNIVKEVTYDSFGIILLDTNPSLDINLGFAGGLYDIDTKLTRFGYRDYDAYTGKWTAKDPIRFVGGDSNLYGYVLGDPVGFVDPSGLFRFGTRPLSKFSSEIGPAYHEHGFFDNGANVGYFDTGVGGDSSSFLPNYNMLPTHYNDNIMMDALNNLLNSGWWLPDGTHCKNKRYSRDCDYDFVGHNCQGFADSLRREYRRLSGMTR